MIEFKSSQQIIQLTIFARELRVEHLSTVTPTITPTNDASVAQSTLSGEQAFADSAFAHGEAENMVIQLRAHLRDGREEQANTLAEAILTRLAARFERYAWASFRERGPAVREDAISEMIFQVCRALKNLSDKPGARFWEQRFNAAVQTCLIDAVRKVGREDERDDEGRQALSLDETLNADDGSATLADITPDPEAMRALENVLGAQLANQLWGQLPSPRHAAIFQLRMGGDNWETIAARAGVSEKTARKYFQESQRRLREILAAAQ
ncbi:MAG: hypothetical protein JWN98_98 [Abditibacteriota bacterium]|nr:hypothetical protein [Abditibacteriota bacterium]